MSWKIIECPECGSKEFNFLKINKDGTACLNANTVRMSGLQTNV